MEIADRTPYRNESGKVDIFGRIQGTFKFGFDWYARLEAQLAVIAVLGKVLGSSYILLCNITLPDTDIELPIVLIGPPGVYLISVTTGRGVYRARDDEWGTVVGDRFVAASNNILQRNVKLGRVLQIYLDRAGFKDKLIVEPILMAADPGMHIESVRPAARIVMSDALERFAISMNQARPIHNGKTIADLAQVIVKGPKAQAAPVAKTENQPPTTQAPASNLAFSTEPLEFSFEDKPQDQNNSPSSASQNATLRAAAFSSDDRLDTLQYPGDQTLQSSQPFPENFEAGNSRTPSENSSRPSSPAPKSKKLFGMSTAQLAILGGVLLFWLCAMAAFAIYLYINH